MQVKYVGGFEEIVIVATGATVKRGESVDVPQEIADGLLVSPDWETPDTKKTNKKGDV